MRDKIIKVGLAITLATVICYIMPDALEGFNVVKEFRHNYPVIYTELIYGTFAFISMLFLPFRDLKFGWHIVRFNWKKILLIIFLIQIIPFASFLMLLFFDELYLSKWMLESLPQIVMNYLIISPIAEELLFRGVIQTLLDPLRHLGIRIKSLRISVPILFSATFFTLIHSGYSLTALIFVFLLGLFCGYLRERYQSLLPAIFAHALFNLLAVFIPRLILILIESRYN